jgi:AraC-like DNA-binding protein
VGHLPRAIREWHLPTTEVPLLLNFAAPHRQRLAGEREEWVELDGSWAVGLRDCHQLTEARGERHFMVVRFTPLGAHLFLKVPMHLLAGQSIPLAAFDSSLSRLVMSRVSAGKSWDDRFTAVETLIAERVLSASVSGSAAWVWNRLSAANGRIALGQLMSEIECSQRHLIKEFRTYVGLSPKMVARLFRFNLAIRTLGGLSRSRAGEDTGKPYIEAASPRAAGGEEISWAEIATGAGYYDQPHFIKEFRHFAGSTPADFLRRTVDVG